MSLWSPFSLTELFKEVLISTRQCQVTIVPLSKDIPVVPHSFLLAPSGCRRESFVISASMLVRWIYEENIREALYQLAKDVPVGCKVWLKWATMTAEKEELIVRARLNTDAWVSLCSEFPFLSMTEVVRLALLSPEKRRLHILGRPTWTAQK